jgi:hypothetical protein
MEPKQFKYSLFSLFALILLMGCNTRASSHASPTVTPSPIPSTTTPTSTPTFTPTFHLTTTPTFTYAPTLPAEQVQENVFAMLKSNGGCKFPCWWGIIPGQTPWQKTDISLRQIGLNLTFDSIAKMFYDIEWFVGEESGVLNSYEVYVNNGVVSFIKISSEGYDNNMAFKRIWKNVSPEFILANYGPPSRIWLQTYSEGCEGGPCITMPYWLWLFYDQRGFLISYNGAVKFDAIYKFCPTFAPDGNLGGSMDIYLKAPTDHKSLEDYANLRPELYQHQELTEKTGMTIDEFYTLYQQTNKPICFETQRDIWK